MERRDQDHHPDATEQPEKEAEDRVATTPERLSVDSSQGDPRAEVLISRWRALGIDPVMKAVEEPRCRQVLRQRGSQRQRQVGPAEETKSHPEYLSATPPEPDPDGRQQKDRENQGDDFAGAPSRERVAQ